MAVICCRKFVESMRILDESRDESFVEVFPEWRPIFAQSRGARQMDSSVCPNNNSVRAAKVADPLLAHCAPACEYLRASRGAQ